MTKDELVHKVYFLKETEYSSKVWVSLNIAGEKLKIEFVLTDDGIFGPDGLEGAFLGRIQKFVINLHTILKQKRPDYSEYCYKKLDGGWAFVRYN